MGQQAPCCLGGSLACQPHLRCSVVTVGAVLFRDAEPEAQSAKDRTTADVPHTCLDCPTVDKLQNPPFCGRGR